MDSLISEKASINTSNEFLLDMLELARLPNTINTLIHKNNSEMAMKLITHFNKNIYDKDSEVLVFLKKEIDILNNKIHQKINVELEDGIAKMRDVKLLLGDNPTKEMMDSYFIKENRIKMNLLKQKLQKALFEASSMSENRKATGEGISLKKSKLSNSESVSSNTGNEVKFYATLILKIFKDELSELKSQEFGGQIKENEVEIILPLNEKYHSISRISTIIKEFAHLMTLIYDKLSYDCENVIYLCELSSEVYKINNTVYYLTEECVINHICSLSIAFSKSIATKLTNIIKSKSNQDHIEDGSDSKQQEETIVKYDSAVKQLKECARTIFTYLNTYCEQAEDETSNEEESKVNDKQPYFNSISNELVVQMVECFYKTFSECLLNSQSDHIATIDFIPAAELHYLQGLIDHACEGAKKFDLGIEGFDNCLIDHLTERFIKNMQTLLMYVCN